MQSIVKGGVRFGPERDRQHQRGSARRGAEVFYPHGGSIASPVYYRKFPIETMDANVNGLRSLLEYAKLKRQTPEPVEGFLFFSSSEIDGDRTPDAIRTPETCRGLRLVHRIRV